ncbi:KAP P-loop protein [Schlegelella sp. ID0723]|uniref:KAP P-loop protein n=2 Tax=Piscinibacter koreensis TaxID=2742824 RepID=A0A7Y6TYF9_9BURK|nr:KAP P-loop protein [Schlegelella koreensis]
MPMPELLVYGRAALLGFTIAEVFRLAFYLGERVSPAVEAMGAQLIGPVVIASLALVLLYGWKRGAFRSTRFIARSLRADLLAVLTLGGVANIAAAPAAGRLHAAFQRADPLWAPAILAALLAVMAASLVRDRRARATSPHAELPLIADDEIEAEGEDTLGVADRARVFAESVVACSAIPGMVFGVDGPWGAGKTSFMNLAQRHWNDTDPGSIITHRFDPLRVAGDPDLAGRLISELATTIRREVFAPEFRPAASRYSRMLKGRAELSFLGFKLTLDPASETLDESLDAIDAILAVLDKRVIIVIDDLDRLEPSAVNSVLFAVRRTLRLSRATYVLCYDTEVLARSESGSELSRQFLEKFVTTKVNLLVESAALVAFLRGGWKQSDARLVSVPSGAMLRLSGILDELANILDAEDAAPYLPVIGNMRQVKRFINELLMARFDKADVARTDFYRRDLVNLMLIHQNYPGLFRRIHGHESGKRSGDYSVKPDEGGAGFINADKFAEAVGGFGRTAEHLARQLFDVAALALGDRREVEQAMFRSRACFNQPGARNLETYLTFITRFVAPEPTETFALYQGAVSRVRGGAAVSEVLAEPDFDLARSERPHNEFWRLLVNGSHDFTRDVAEGAIDALVSWMPRYSTVETEEIGLRQTCVYSLARLLDSAGWGRTTGRRLPNSGQNVVEIAERIFGSGRHKGKSLIDQLAAPDRGVLGWHDLALFRLTCSADRQGQLHNLTSALLLHEDPEAQTAGLLNELARNGMRRLSQEVFRRFDAAWIAPRRNFLAEVDRADDRAFLGEVGLSLLGSEPSGSAARPLADLLPAARSSVKSFFLYQLCNARPATGVGVGCGYYDESGSEDRGGIAERMNAYAFGVCFNAELEPSNRLLFADYCLCQLSRGSWPTDPDTEFAPSPEALRAGFDPVALREYWKENRERYRDLPALDRRVVTHNYVACYREDLPRVFEVLDAMVSDRYTDPEALPAGSA